MNYVQPVVTDNLDVKAWSSYMEVDRVDIFEYGPTGNGYIEYKFFIRKDDYTDEIIFVRPQNMDDYAFLERVKQVYEERVLGRLAKQAKKPKKLQHILDLQDKVMDMMSTYPSDWQRSLIEDLQNGK